MPKIMPVKTPVIESPPEETTVTPDSPNESELKKEQPKNLNIKEEKPEKTEIIEEKPEETKPVEETPEVSPEKEEMPSDMNEENTVVVCGQKVEIKPTKLKYFRNKGASAYGIIKAIPLHELLTYDKGVIDPVRDADQLLYDFLVAAFDDPDFVRDNYNDMDAEAIDRVIKIFGRINHIDEKEEAARKNREAQERAKR